MYQQSFIEMELIFVYRLFQREVCKWNISFHLVLGVFRRNLLVKYLIQRNKKSKIFSLQLKNDFYYLNRLSQRNKKSKTRYINVKKVAFTAFYDPLTTGIQLGCSYQRKYKCIITKKSGV